MLYRIGLRFNKSESIKSKLWQINTIKEQPAVMRVTAVGVKRAEVT
jgi:hypothetical protein